MAEYWQDKRINRGHVACAWGLVLVVVAIMLAVTTLTAPDCPDAGDTATAACADAAAVREAKAQHR